MRGIPEWGVSERRMMSASSFGSIWTEVGDAEGANHEEKRLPSLANISEM